MRARATGFTILELVISAALMSMILAAAYLCLSAGVSSRELVESREEILQSARVAMGLLSADLRGACTLSKEFEFSGMRRLLGETQADNLDFATHHYAPQREHEGDWCEVSYFLEKDRESGRFNLWRRRDPTPDDQPYSGGTRQEIARGLLGLKFEYYDGFDWFDEWGDPDGRGKLQSSLKDRPNLSGLPEAVRITLWFDSESRPLKAAPLKRDPEPPMVFQMEVRLNLAAVASRGGAAGSQANSASAASQPTGPLPGAAP